MKTIKWEGYVPVYVAPLEKELAPGDVVEVDDELAKELTAREREPWSLVKSAKKKSEPKEEPSAESAADAAEEVAE